MLENLQDLYEKFDSLDKQPKGLKTFKKPCKILNKTVASLDKCHKQINECKVDTYIEWMRLKIETQEQREKIQKLKTNEK